MFRYHRVLYRRLLRGQSVDELVRLRAESGMFPTLLQLIDDELGRREAEGSATGRDDEQSRYGLPRPFVPSISAQPMS